MSSKREQAELGGTRAGEEVVGGLDQWVRSPLRVGLLQRVAGEEAASQVRPVDERPAEMTRIVGSAALMAPVLAVGD